MTGYILGEGGKVAGVANNPFYVAATTSEGEYPQSLNLILPTTANTGAGSYTATDNVTVTLSLSDSGTNPDTMFSGFLRYKDGQEMPATGLRRTNGYDEALTTAANNTVSWDVPAGFTFIIRFSASTTGTRAAVGTVSP